MRRRARFTALLLALPLGAPQGARASDAAACSVSASVDRAEVTVGEQLVYRIRSLRRADVTAAAWLAVPHFPGFRAIWLSEAPTGESPLRDGHRYQARELRYALFPERAGAFPLEAPGLRCTTGAGVDTRSTVVRAPAATVQVRPWPAGAPADFDGLVGPVELRTLITPREIRLGESVRVAVVIRGEGALWNAREPLLELADAEVFRRGPEETSEAGERLTVKQHFAFDVVPLRIGSLALPGFGVSYYDPAGGRFARAVSEPVAVRVLPRRSDPASGRAPEAFDAAGPGAAARGVGGGTGAEAPRKRFAWVAGLVCLATLGVLGADRLRRRRAAGRRAPAAHLDAADPDAAARALRAALARHLAGADALTAEEIRQHPALPLRAVAAAELLVAVDRARFDPDSAAPAAERVARAIAAL